jgi:hypothetical protein
MRTASISHGLFAVAMFGLLTHCVVLPGSNGFRRRPFRLRRPPLRNASPIQIGHRRLQKFREDWFQVERGGVCVHATLVLLPRRYQF